MLLKYFEWFFNISLFINALLFIPQIIALLKTKHPGNLSLILFSGLNVIQITIIIHAYLLKDYQLMFGFMLALITCGTVTGLIIYYKCKAKQNSTCQNYKKDPTCQIDLNTSR